MNETITGFSDSVSHFTRREWVFKVINQWLTDANASRCFLLTGLPGSGKTAIASRLVQYSQGILPPLEQASQLTKCFLSATHFCSAENILRSSPHEFIRILSLQLAERYQIFAHALAQQREDRRLNIDLVQNVEHMTGGQVTGIVINNLNVSGLPPKEAFIKVVLNPLNVLLHSQPGLPVIILVDALDEALSSSQETTIASLLASVDKLSAADLPSEVRFLLTSRQDTRVVNELLNAQELMLSSAEFNQNNEDDIRRYLQVRLENDKSLADHVALAEPRYQLHLKEIVPRKARRNFQYVRFLLDAIAQGLRSLTSLEGLPEGLDGLYFDSLKRVVELGKRDWFSAYAPLIGVLSVAQESLTLAQLQALTQQPKSSIQEYRRNLQQFIEEVTVEGEPEKKYRLYHQSVVDFLHQEELFLEKKTKENIFYLPADEWHKNVADRCENGGLALLWEMTQEDLVEQSRREYARLHYIAHLYQAKEWKRLCAVLDAGEYGQRKVKYYLSALAYAQDLELGQQAVTRHELQAEDAIDLLPALWRYSLLRRSLGTHVDTYPDIVFRVLVVLGRQQQALELVRLLTDMRKQVKILLDIGAQIEEEGHSEEAWQIFLQARGTILAQIENDPGIIHSVVQQFAEVQPFKHKVRFLNELTTIAQLMRDDEEKLTTLLAIAVALSEAHEKQQAEAVGQTIPYRTQDEETFKETVKILVKAGLWNSATRLVLSMQDKANWNSCLSSLVVGLLKAQEWEKAKELALLSSMDLRFDALLTVVSARAKVQPELTEELLSELESQAFAEDAHRDYEYFNQKTSDRDFALELLAREMAELHLWDKAIGVAWSIYNYGTCDSAFSFVIKELVKVEVWEKAIKVAQAMYQKHESEKSNQYSPVKAFHDIARGLVKANQREQARELLTQMQQMLAAHDQKDFVLQELVQALLTVELWDRAETVIETISDTGRKCDLLIALASALSTLQPEHTHILLSQVETLVDVDLSLGKQVFYTRQQEIKAQRRNIAEVRAKMQRQEVAVLAKTQRWEQAIETAQSIDWSIAVEQDNAFADIIDALVIAQEWSRILPVAQHMHKEMRAEKLMEVVKTLSIGCNWEHALYLVQAIDFDQYKVNALTTLIDELEMTQSTEISKFISDREGALSDTLDQVQVSSSAKEHHSVPSEISREHKGLDTDEEELLADLLSDGDALPHDEQALRDKREFSDDLAKSHASAMNNLDADTEASGWLRATTPFLVLEQYWKSVIQEAHAIDNNRMRDETLAKLLYTLVQVNLLDMALQVAQLFISQEDQAEALLLIVPYMFLAGQQKWAIAIAHSIKKSKQKAEALAYLAAALARIQPDQAQALLSEVLTAAQFITDNEKLKTGALFTLAEGSLQAKQWDQARLIIRSLPDAAQRVTLLLDKAHTLASGESKTALSLLLEAVTETQSLDSFEKLEYQDKIAEELLALGATKQVNRLRSEMLITLALLLQEQGKTEKGEQLRSMASVLLTQEQGETEKGEQLRSMASVLLTIEEKELAEVLWSEIMASFSEAQEPADSWDEKDVVAVEEDDAMLEWERESQRHEREARINKQKDKQLIAEIKNKMHGQIEQAVTLLFERLSADDHFSDDILLRDLVDRLCQKQQHEQALALVWSINKPWQKAQALTAIACTLVRQGYQDKARLLLLEAEATAQSIEKEEKRTDIVSYSRSEKRDTALFEVGQALIQVREIEAAEIVASSMTRDSWQRDHIFLECIEALGDMQQWDKALEKMPSIKGEDRRVLSKTSIIESLVRYKQDSRALQILQQTWRDAPTRDDLLKDFVQVKAFIIRKPDMAWALYEAFTWVDEFLKG